MKQAENMGMKVAVSGHGNIMKKSWNVTFFCGQSLDFTHFVHELCQIVDVH